MFPQTFPDPLLHHKRFVHGQVGDRPAELRFADLLGLRHPKINLSGGLMVGVNLSHSSLKETDLRGSQLRSTNLEEADLHLDGLVDGSHDGKHVFMDLSETSMEGTVLEDANLSGTVFRDITLPNGRPQKS